MASAIRLAALLALLLASMSMPGTVQAYYNANCPTYSANAWQCTDQGSAYLGCEALRASQANPSAWICELKQGTNYDCHQPGNNFNHCVSSPSGVYNHTFGANTCASVDPINSYSDSQCLLDMTNVCLEGCQFQPTSGACAGDPVVWSTADFTPDGEVCSPAGSAGDPAPEGCSLQEGVVVCDCVADPDAPFCPGGANENNCTQNGDGTATCDPNNTNPGGGGGGGGGTDPGSGGGPGNDGTPGDGDPAPGESCNAGDPNCYNGSGGVCQTGETCTVSDSGAGGVGGVGTCDPNIQNCEGQGSANTSGSCQVEPSCSGDAIQCAILVQSWKNRCTLEDLKGEKPPWQADPDYGKDLADSATSINVSNQLDQAGFASGSCPSNPSVTVFNSTFEIDMVPLCDIAGYLRYFVILITLLWAGQYVIRSF